MGSSAGAAACAVGADPRDSEKYGVSTEMGEKEEMYGNVGHC